MWHDLTRKILLCTDRRSYPGAAIPTVCGLAVCMHGLTRNVLLRAAAMYCAAIPVHYPDLPSTRPPENALRQLSRAFRPELPQRVAPGPDFRPAACAQSL